MSRGFVKEGDQEEIPMVPPRAHLPNGIENYVTEKGLLALLKEKESLIKERDSYKQDMKNSGAEADIRVTRNFINAKIDLLDERIKTAKVIKSSEQTQDQIAFSAKVKLRMSGRAPITIHITGVDEADFSKGNIAFISPLAKALIGMKKGDKKEIELPNGKQNIEIIDIQY